MPGSLIWISIVAVVICALGALALVRSLATERRMRALLEGNRDLSRRLAEMEPLLEEMQADNKALSSFLVVLPDVVRRLNSDNGKRGIPPLLASTLEQIFEPAQILIYTTRSKDELLLTVGQGLPEGVEPGHRIKFGEGRIGMVARSQMAMDRDDIMSESLFRHKPPEALEPPGIVIDLIAPMMHKDETLGVICVGKPGRRHRDEKRMIKLVADLGSLALKNSDLITKLENVANADSLTGLSSKGFLKVRLGVLTNRAEQTHSPLSLIIFDIDHFKRYNDTYGHLAGDEILKEVASILKSQLRSDDTAARYGGEEFVVVLPNTDKEDAARIAEKIRRAIEQHPFSCGGGSPGKPGTVTISGGVASLLVDGKSSQEILGAADQALYLAKEQGRNRIVQFKSRYLSDDEAEREPAVW